jgi:hypothetical protein
MATLTAPTMVLASVLSTLLWNWKEDYSILGFGTAASLLASLFFLNRIEEPRGRSLGHKTL